MRILFLGILMVSVTVIVVLNATPIGSLEYQTPGGGSFIPSVFGSAAVASISVVAVAIACWVAPKLAFRSQLLNRMRPGEILVMIQTTDKFRLALAGISPSLLMPIIASDEGVRFFGARGTMLSISASDVLWYRLNPKGYQGRIPTIEMSFRDGAEVCEVDFVVAREGFEIVPEKRLPMIEAIRHRLQELASGAAPKPN